MADQRGSRTNARAGSADERDDSAESSARGESEDSASSGESKQDLAEERTDWAQERTLLAKQRTFAAWLRTGLASAGAGFAAAEFLGELGPRWLVTTASVLLVIAGAVIFVIGFLGYRETFRKLEKEGVEGMHPWVIAGVTLAMLLGALLLLYSVVA